MGLHRKKPPAQGHGSSERYIITYADLITLLLVFFIVLYSMAEADNAKFQQVSESLSRAFNVDVVEWPDRAPSASTIEQEPRFIEYLSVRGQVASIIERLQLPSNSADVELTNEGIVIHLADAVLFPPGDAQLRPEGMRVLSALAEVIIPLPNPVRVEGHTDHVSPENAAYQDNWELSAARALSALRYLTTVHYVLPERLAAAGYGQYRPRADNDTVEGRQLNRRVDIVILQGGGLSQNLVPVQ